MFRRILRVTTLISSAFSITLSLSCEKARLEVKIVSCLVIVLSCVVMNFWKSWSCMEPPLTVPLERSLDSLGIRVGLIVSISISSGISSAQDTGLDFGLRLLLEVCGGGLDKEPLV